MAVLKGSLIPSRITEAQNCHPLSHLLSLPFVFFLSLQPPSKRFKIAPSVPQWEVTPDFDPKSAVKPSVPWVKSDNSPVEMAQGMTADNLHISQDFIKAVLNGHALADVSTLSFRDPATFVVGSIHSHFSAWKQISKVAPYELTPKILRWIKNCIDVQGFFSTF